MISSLLSYWQVLPQHLDAPRQLQSDLNRKPSDQEVADVLEITVDEWQQVRIASSNRSLLSLDAPVKENDSGMSSLGDLLPDSRYRSFQLAQEDWLRLQQALSQLEKRTREVVEFVFLHDLTQKETAERLGISSVTVSRQIKKGLKHLQVIMRSKGET